MATTTFNGPVRSEKGFQVATKNTATGAITTRQSSGMPDLTGLSIADVGTATNLTLAANTISVINYTGAAAATCTLPAATRGSIVVYCQSKDTTGGTATLIFDAAGSDVWATGSVIESRGSSEVTFDTSAANETKMTFTPANATTNLLTTGGQIVFICYEQGTWHIATKLAAETTQVTGAFVFAA
tara:strand:- start:1064 stop:1618 length:555 start_codon:yes stop_codon:yes gene_type:complete